MARPRLAGRQGLLLVLALGLLGVAGHRFWGQYERAAGKEVPARRRQAQQLGVASQPQRAVYAVDAYSSPSDQEELERADCKARPALEIHARLPEGRGEGTFSVYAGERLHLVTQFPCRTEVRFSESPQRSEMRHYVLQDKAGGLWSYSMPCPPILRGVRAVGAPDRVTLCWDVPDTSAGVWVSGPEVVVLRADPLELLAAREVRSGRVPRVRYRRIARVSPSAARYEDADIESGTTYLYRLAVVGEVQAQAVNRDSGEPETVVRKVQAVVPVDNVLFGLVVTAEPPRPLRVAVTCDRSCAGNPVCQAAAQMVRDGLPGLPWVLVTSRDAPQQVASEKAVASMGQDEGGVSAGELLPAEACLRIEIADMPDDAVEVWLEDYLEGRHVRLARAPLYEPKRLLDELGVALARCFPEKAACRVEREQPTERRPRLAVLAFRPTSRASSVQLSRGALRSLITGELTSSTRFEVLDREWTDAAFAEQERLALQGEAGMARLGQTLGADYLLSGNYRVSDGELSLQAYLIDVSHGTRSSLSSSRGTIEDMGSIVHRLEAALRLPRPPEEMTGAIPLKLAFGLDRSLAGEDYRKRIDAAALARSPDPRDVLLAAQRLETTDPQRAEALVRQVLRRDDRSDPERLFETTVRLDELLRLSGGTKERVGIWQQLAESIPDPGKRRDLGVPLYLCEALCDAGQQAEAGCQMEPGKDGLRNILAYTELGMFDEAWEQCRREPALSREQLGPGYAGAVFLLRHCGAKLRQRILQQLARDLPPSMGRQVQRALLELEAAGDLPDDLWGVSLENAIRTQDRPRQQQSLRMLHKAPPDEQVRILGRCMALAADRGERPLVEAMMDLLRKVEPNTPDGRRMKEIRLRLGLPRIAPPPPEPELAVAQLGKLLANHSSIGRKLGDTLILLSTTERLVAYNRKTKELLWHLDLAPCAYTLASNPREEQWGKAAVELSRGIWATADAIYVSACQDGRVFAVDPASGKVRWCHVAWSPVSPPVVSDDGKRVAIAEAIGTFVVLDAQDGTPLRAVSPRGMLTEERRYKPYVDLRRTLWVDTEYRIVGSPWAIFVRSQRFSASSRGPWRRRSYYAAGHSGSPYRQRPDESRFWLNLDTLEYRTGDFPQAESRERLLAKLQDHELPEDERKARISHSTGRLPPEVLCPVLMQIAGAPEEPMPVRDAALQVLVEDRTSDAIAVAADFYLAFPTSDPQSARRTLMLPPTKAVGLDDQAVQMLVRLLQHRDPVVRGMAVHNLVGAMGAESWPHVVSLLPELEEELGDRWKAQTALAMAARGMPQAIPLLQSIATTRLTRRAAGETELSRSLRRMARQGCREAEAMVAIPFDESKSLEELAGIASKGAGWGALPHCYEWIRKELPLPRFAPFLRESLAVAPPRMRPGIVAAQLRVAGPDLLPAYTRELVRNPQDAFRPGVNLLARQLPYAILRSMTGVDLGTDLMAWEQYVRFRTDPTPAESK